MNTFAVGAAALAGGAALCCWRGRSPADLRVAGLGLTPDVHQPPETVAAGRSSPMARRVASLLLGLAAVALVGGPWGLVGAVTVAVLANGLLARLEPRAERDRRERMLADLPLALDLAAACLAGGSTIGGALSAVAAAVGGPLGAEFDHVLAALRLGASPTKAFARLTGPPELASVATAMARAATSGTAASDAISRLAADQRSAAAARGQAAAQRAGVAAVLPLAACFLPAFVLLGVVPVVAGIALRLLH